MRSDPARATASKRLVEPPPVREHAGGPEPMPGVRPVGSETLRLLTLPEVADLLRLSEKTVRRLVAARRMPCVRLGRQLRFVQSDIVRWVSARKEG